MIPPIPDWLSLSKPSLSVHCSKQEGKDFDKLSQAGVGGLVWNRCLTTPALRLDKFLWFARITKTRSAAQDIAEVGHCRISGRVIDRAHCPVRVGDVLSFPLHDRVRIIRVEAIPTRRGPAAEARACYTDLSPGVDASGPRE